MPNPLDKDLKDTVDESLLSSGKQTSYPVDKSSLEPLKGKVDETAAAYEGLSKPNTALRILQNAIQAKTRPGQQPIGESPIFQAAGLGGSMGALSASLQSRGKEIELNTAEFRNAITNMAGTYKDLMSSALFNYQRAVNEYNTEANRLQELDKILLQHELGIRLTNLRHDLDKELKGIPTFADKVNALEEGYNIVNGEFVKRLPNVGTSIDTHLGKGTVTSYGSDYWAYGWDVQLEGGMDADISIPFDFEFYGYIPESQSNGFGIQAIVKTMDGQEVWFSHLSEGDLNPGSYLAGTSIGKQGNTGATIGETGIHVDITMPKATNPDKANPDHWYSPQEIAYFFGATGDDLPSGEVKTTYRDIGGRVIQIIEDAKTGRILEQNDLGIRSTDLSKVKESIAAFQAADGMLSQIEGLADAVITAEDPTDIPKQFFTGNIDAITKADPEAAVFLSSVNAFSSMLARAAGEKGVLTDQDVQRIINALPKLTDTKASKDLKIKTLRSLYEATKNGAITAYTMTEEDVLGYAGSPGEAAVQEEDVAGDLTYLPGTQLMIDGEQYMVGADGQAYKINE